MSIYNLTIYNVQFIEAFRYLQFCCANNYTKDKL